MPLELTDFDQTGLDIDALALIVAAAPPNIYADADRGGTQTPEGGDIGLGSGETRISRIRITNSGQGVTVNDNDQPEALSLSAHFGARNTVSPWTLYIQTDSGAVSSAQLGNTGAGFVNFEFGADDASILNGIADGDRFLIGVAQVATQPIAATFAGAAGSLSAAVTKQAPAVKPVAGTFAGAAGSLTAAVTKQTPSSKPVAGRFTGVAGSLTAVLTKQAVRQPMAALTASETTIERGRSVELRWVASGAVSASIEPGIGAVATSGSVRVTPDKPTVYMLKVRGGLGTTPTWASVAVDVTHRAPRSLLPPNATPFERAMEAAARQPLDVPIPNLWSAMECPVALLPYLAWALGVEDWDSAWPEAVQRLAVADAFRIHREKGTLAGLKRLLGNAGAEHEYSERPAGVPMTALLRIFNSNAVYLPDITAAIGRVKRASLDLDIELVSSAMGEIPVAGGLGAATFVEISDWRGYGV